MGTSVIGPCTETLSRLMRSRSFIRVTGDLRGAKIGQHGWKTCEHRRLKSLPDVSPN
jgi:hypothetical protein